MTLHATPVLLGLTLSLTDLALGLVLVAATVGFLVIQGVGLARDVTFVTLRALVQVTALGFVLHLLAGSSSWLGLLAVVFLMTTLATYHAMQGLGRLPYLPWIAVAAIVTTTLGVIGFLSAVVLRINPLDAPIYTIALTGMVLANAMNGFHAFTRRFATSVYERRDEVEVKLGLGADVRESVRGPLREALRTAVLPVGNLLVVVGIVQVPGVMAGQLFAGAAPFQATAFAVLMIEAAIASVLCSALLAGMLTYGLFFTPAMQLKETPQ